jgi:hypothetical protein
MCKLIKVIRFRMPFVITHCLFMSYEDSNYCYELLPSWKGSCFCVLAVNITYTCEGNTMNVTCQDSVIEILNVNYGRLSASICDIGSSSDVNCKSTTALDIVMKLCVLTYVSLTWWPEAVARLFRSINIMSIHFVVRHIVSHWTVVRLRELHPSNA